MPQKIITIGQKMIGEMSLVFGLFQTLNTFIFAVKEKSMAEDTNGG